MKNHSTLKPFFLIIVAGFVLLPLFNGCKKVIGSIPEEAESPINVTTTEVKPVQAYQTIKYSGTIEAVKTIPIGFSVSGNVSNVFVSEGDEVKKGQLLAELNPETFKNAYTMALASRKQAEDALERMKTMYRNGNLPEIKMIDVETKHQQAKSAAAIAGKNLNDCRLYAAADGVIGRRSIEVGQSVMPGVSVMTIVKIEEVHARISVSENEISTITLGDQASVVIPAAGSKVCKGEVEKIGVMGDPLAHTYKVKILVPNKENILKPGMICNVILNRKRIRVPLMVPLEAVQVDNDGKQFVYAVANKGNCVEKKYVETGSLLNDGIEILAGLQRGEKVVVSGQHKLWGASAIHITEN